MVTYLPLVVNKLPPFYFLIYLKPLKLEVFCVGTKPALYIHEKVLTKNKRRSFDETSTRRYKST